MAHGLEIKYKREFHPIRWVIWMSVLVAICLGGWFGYRYFTEGELPPLLDNVGALKADPSVDESPVTNEQIDRYTVAPDLPRYLSIPSIGVAQTRVYSVGIDKNNQLEAPKNIHDAAWYTKSMKPGQGYGAALINAHNGGVTKDGVFAKLKELKKGDSIELERGDGKMLTYKVVENQSMSLEEVNRTGMKMMMQSAQNDKEGLNLITCDGKWVPALKQYDRRIMLRAVLDT